MEPDTSGAQDETLAASRNIEEIVLEDDQSINEILNEEDDGRPVHLGDPVFYREEENPPENNIHDDDTVSLLEEESSTSEEENIEIQPEEIAGDPIEERTVVIPEPEIIDQSDGDDALSEAVNEMQKIDDYYEFCEEVMREVMSIEIPNTYRPLTEPVSPP